MQNVKTSRCERPIAALVLLVACLLPATASTLGAQSVASSSAYGEAVNLSLLPLLGSGITVANGPLPQVSGSASPAYSKTGTVASAAVSTALTGSLLQTGVINVAASSQMPAAVPTQGTAVTNNAALTLGHLIPLLSLTAQAIQSSAAIDGTCGASLTAAGVSDLVGAAIGGSVATGVVLPGHPAPNTVLLNVAGVRIVLNEQVQTGDGVESRGLTVNAVHVYLTNALLSGLGVLSGDIVISQSQASVQCPAAAPSADLRISGSASPATATPGGALQYDLTVTNQGPSVATGVTLTDVLPAGLGSVSASPGQGTCSVGAQVSCGLGTLNAGQSVHVTIAGTVTASSGTLTDTASVTSGVADPDAASNSVTFSTPVQSAPPASADLTLTGHVSPDPAVPGGQITYTITVTNHGPDAATSVVLTDTLPSGVSSPTVQTTQGSCGGGNPILCTLGTLPAGGVATVTLTGIVDATGGTLVDVATVTSGVADPDPSGNTMTMTTPVAGIPQARADLAVTATRDAASVQVGQTSRFTFTVANHGPDAAAHAALGGPPVPRAQILSVQASQGSCNTDNGLACDFGSLASGQQATVTITVVPQAAQTMSCQATASSAAADPNLSNNTASADVTVVSAPTSTPVDAGACRIDVVPAATLLFPYFEVDLDHPNGATTLISINNASAASTLAQVTLWSDWGIPTYSFTMALTGYDVQTLNLRDLLTTGALPASGGCAGQASALSQAAMSHLRAWHCGEASPTQGTCVASPRGGHLATGYVTVDAVNRCSSANPTTAGYFVAGGSGIASDRNVLWGDFFLVSGDDFQAHGDPAVHILALPGTFTNHYSFYGAFVGGSGRDDRQPLGTSYASRYVSGGIFDGGTQLLVWRDAKVAHPAPLACGQEPARMELAGTLFDEEEHASVIPSSKNMAPWSTQKMVLGAGSFPLPHPFGWAHLDLWHQGGTLFGDAAQGWVTTVMSAQTRFSVGLRAVRLDSACDF